MPRTALVYLHVAATMPRKLLHQRCHGSLRRDFQVPTGHGWESGNDLFHWEILSGAFLT